VYNLSNLQDKYIHLTNDAVQKKSEEYGKHENGNKVSLVEFSKYLENNHKVQFDPLFQTMKSIARTSIESVYYKIDPNRINNTFEVFGLDFMIDTQFDVYLIEINTNPDITACCQLLLKLMSHLVENILRITVDTIFPPPHIINSPFKKPYIP
jgi:tubulin--tyrosine ligase